MNPPPKIHTGETHFAHAGFSEETETPSRSGTFRIGRATGFSDAPGNYQVREFNWRNCATVVVWAFRPPSTVMT